MALKHAIRSATDKFGRLRTVLATVATVGAAAALRDAASAPPASCDQTDIAIISEGPPLPGGRACHAGGSIDGRVVVAGGSAWSADRTTKSWLDDTLVFDALQGTWLAGPRLPHPIAEMMFGCDGSELYLAGGKNDRTTYADAYRIVSRDRRLMVESLPPLPAPLSGGAGAVLNGHFYVAGGYDENNAATDALWALNLRQPGAAWHSCAALPIPKRGYFGLVACDGALYLLGGCIVETKANPKREVFKDIYRYDPHRDEWSRLPDLPTAGQGWVADAVDDHHILLAGRGDTGVYDEVWLVDLRDSSVRGMGSLTVPSFGAPLVRMQANRWWFIGGEPDANKSRTPRVSVIELK